MIIFVFFNFFCILAVSMAAAAILNQGAKMLNSNRTADPFET
jgi:hypothetical protein